MATKKANTTFQLAFWFVTDFLGKTWSHNIHLRHLAHAKSFLNPKRDDECEIPQRRFTPDEIKGCLLDMRRKGIKNINTLRAVTWTDSSGASYIEKFTEPEPMPPIYMTMEVAQWHERNASL